MSPSLQSTHRLASFSSPPKATTVLIADSTSAAMAPADVYSSSSKVENLLAN